MLYGPFRFLSSLLSYVFEELLNNSKTNNRRLEPTIGPTKDLEEEKELPTIKLD